MRVLRFLGSTNVEAAPDRESLADGLEAFTSEHGPDTPPDATSGQPVRRLHWVIGVLAIAVVVEAVPAALWIRSTLQPPAAPAVESPAATLATDAIVAAPPCEPTLAAAPAAGPSLAVTSTATPSAVAPRALAGSVSITAPVPMRVFERGRLIGTTEAETMMLAVGTHDLELVNEAVGFRVRRTINVQAGRTVSVQVAAPMGTLHVNAVPWAEVWIDDERVGETPIGNLKTAIGNHEVVFRHPELGERRAAVLVTLTAPARLSMDLRQK